MDWLITIPQTVNWNTYAEEMKTVEDYSQVMNYRVPFRPTACVGDRCYIVYKGRVRGWMSIVGIANHPHGFRCTTSGTVWPPGWYIQRSGPYHPVDGPFKKGFQGIRRYTQEDHAKTRDITT